MKIVHCRLFNSVVGNIFVGESFISKLTLTQSGHGRGKRKRVALGISAVTYYPYL